MKAADPKYCKGRSLAINKGVIHSSNKERCSPWNLDDLLWKYCKSRYADLSCSDVHWNFWWMCNALRLGSEVCNWYRLAIGEDLEKKQHKCLKQSTVFILHFAPSLRFTLSLQSAFYYQSAFYPWSAVCSPQSAFYTDRFAIFAQMAVCMPRTSRSNRLGIHSKQSLLSAPDFTLTVRELVARLFRIATTL